MSRTRRSAAALILASAALAGCAGPVMNVKLAGAPDPASGYRFSTVGATDSLCVCVALSGGGVRAAAFALGVLEELGATRLGRDGKTRLLDEVACLSCVSGGAFTGAAFALDGEKGLEAVRRDVLAANLERDLELKVLSNAWWLWADSRRKRSDLAADLYDEALFHGRTFGDLKAGRPFLIINATDLSTGTRFAFTQDDFDRIGSDLAPFPIARAVAASAAFPFLLATVKLANHQGSTKSAHEPSPDPRVAAWDRERARLQGPSPPAWLHLTDGGVSDNSGVRGLWEALRRPDGFLRRQVDQGKVRRVLVIAVDARNDPLLGLGQSEQAPASVTVLDKAGRVTVNTLSAETILALRDDRVVHEALAKKGATLTVAHVTLDLVQDPERRARLKALPTTLSLPASDIELLIEAGREAVRTEPELARALAELR